MSIKDKPYGQIEAAVEAAIMAGGSRKFEYVSQLPDGAGPVVACTMFNGMLLAATEKGMYQLVGSEWRRLEFVSKGGDGD